MELPFLTAHLQENVVLENLYDDQIDEILYPDDVMEHSTSAEQDDPAVNAQTGDRTPQTRYIINYTDFSSPKSTYPDPRTPLKRPHHTVSSRERESLKSPNQRRGIRFNAELLYEWLKAAGHDPNGSLLTAIRIALDYDFEYNFPPPVVESAKRMKHCKIPKAVLEAFLQKFAPKTPLSAAAQAFDRFFSGDHLCLQYKDQHTVVTAYRTLTL
jgi:hypothetical protein